MYLDNSNNDSHSRHSPRKASLSRARLQFFPPHSYDSSHIPGVKVIEQCFSEVHNMPIT